MNVKESPNCRQSNTLPKKGVLISTCIRIRQKGVSWADNSERDGGEEKDRGKWTSGAVKCVKWKGKVRKKPSILKSIVTKVVKGKSRWSSSKSAAVTLLSQWEISHYYNNSTLFCSLNSLGSAWNISVCVCLGVPSSVDFWQHNCTQRLWMKM